MSEPTTSIWLVCISVCVNVCVFALPPSFPRMGDERFTTHPWPLNSGHILTSLTLSLSLTHTRRQTLTLTFAIADTNIHQISSYQTVEPPHTADGCLKQQNVTRTDVTVMGQTFIASHITVAAHYCRPKPCQVDLWSQGSLIRYGDVMIMIRPPRGIVSFANSIF